MEVLLLHAWSAPPNLQNRRRALAVPFRSGRFGAKRIARSLMTRKPDTARPAA